MLSTNKMRKVEANIKIKNNKYK